MTAWRPCPSESLVLISSAFGKEMIKDALPFFLKIQLLEIDSKVIITLLKKMYTQNFITTKFMKVKTEL